MNDSYEDYISGIKKIEDKLWWKKAVSNNTQMAYENYLTNYPNGIYSFEAKQRIDELIKIEREKKLEQQRLRDIEIAKERDRLEKIEKEKKLALDREKEAWELVCKKDTKEDYENYLTSYSDGIYSFEARQRIYKFIKIREKELEQQRLRDIEIAKERDRLEKIEKEKKLALDREKEAWELACKKNTKEYYENYLISYPNGIYLFEAKQRIDEFIKIEREKKLEQQRLKDIEIAKEKEKQLEIQRLQEIERDKILDNNSWNKTLEENMAEIYLEYIQNYPKGIYRQKAQEKYTEELEKEKDIQKLIDYAKEHNISKYNIPHDLKSLKNTTSIEFWSEKIEKLPKEICKLEKLTELTIQHCTKLEELPLWLNDLKNLKKLRISQTINLPNISNLNKLVEFEYFFSESEEGFDLSELMYKLPKSIEVLKLRREDYRWNSKLPKELIEFINLKELYLENFITGDKELPKWIKDIKSLKKLFINNIHIEKIPDFLTNLEVLSIYLSEKLDLSHSIAKLINLKELSIRGKIPEDIGKLINLKKLSIDTNNKLPSSIGNIINLEELKIENYTLREVPNWIENLKKLNKLSISGGYSTHTLIEIVPTWIGDLKNLKALDLGYNYIKYLPESIGNLTNLETLILSFNKLVYLPESIGMLNNLKYLQCSNNKLTYIPESIGNIKYLKDLFICDNSLESLPKSIDNLIYINLENLKKEVAKQIIGNKEREAKIFNLIAKIDKPISNLQELSKIKKLKIKLESSDDADDIKRHLIERLVSLEELEVFGSSSDSNFYIDNEFIGLKKLKKLNLNKIKTSIFNNKVLSHLDLKELSIDTGDTSSIESIESLEILRLTSLNWRGGNPFPNIEKLYNLKELYFEGEYTKEVSEDIDKLKNLEVLHLKCKKLESLPDSMENLANLKKLYLVDCYNLKKLPNIGKLKNLQEITINDYDFLDLEEFEKISSLFEWSSEYYKNYYGGKIGVKDLIDLKTITKLDWRDEKISNIPESIDIFINLEELDISNNNLQQLPENICNLKSLIKLDVSSNPLETLPQNIGNLTKLKELELWRTKLTILPESICNLSSIEYIGVSEKRIKELPKNIKKLPKNVRYRLIEDIEGTFSAIKNKFLG